MGNGTKVGAAGASAYNPNTFDITDVLQTDAKNVLAVQMKTKPSAWEFDVNDDWSLSGRLGRGTHDDYCAASARRKHGPSTRWSGWKTMESDK